jgi:hypothetical protein
MITYGTRIRLSRFAAGYKSRLDTDGQLPFCTRKLDDYETDKRVPDGFDACAMANTFRDPALAHHYCHELCPISQMFGSTKMEKTA